MPAKTRQSYRSVAGSVVWSDGVSVRLCNNDSYPVETSSVVVVLSPFKLFLNSARKLTFLNHASVQARPCWPRLLPTRHRLPSCVSWAQSSFRSTWVTVPSSSESFSESQMRTHHQSSSLTKSTPSAPSGMLSHLNTLCLQSSVFCVSEYFTRCTCALIHISTNVNIDIEIARLIFSLGMILMAALRD